jgi:hypothetical protein
MVTRRSPGLRTPSSGSRSLQVASITTSSRSTSGVPSAPEPIPRPKSRAAPSKSPDEVARALRQHHTKQAVKRLRAGETWQDHDLVFRTRNGKLLAAGNARRIFRSITKAVGIGGGLEPQENCATPSSRS